MRPFSNAVGLLLAMTTGWVFWGLAPSLGLDWMLGYILLSLGSMAAAWMLVISVLDPWP